MHQIISAARHIECTGLRWSYDSNRAALAQCKLLLHFFQLQRASTLRESGCHALAHWVASILVVLQLHTAIVRARYGAVGYRCCWSSCGTRYCGAAVQQHSGEPHKSRRGIVTGVLPRAFPPSAQSRATSSAVCTILTLLIRY